MKHFILRTDHKPLEWLAIVSDAHGRRGRWVGLLQDFSFKIMHRPGLKHANVDALSRNPVGSVVDDDDFGEGIQDVTADASEGEGELLYVQRGGEAEWISVRRKDRRFIQHDACCFGINHWICSSHHHLYMLDVAMGENPSEGSTPAGEVISGRAEPVQHKEVPVVVKRKRPQYLNKQQQLELVLAAQEMSELRDPSLSPTDSDDEEDCEGKTSCMDIWKDADCLTLLREGVLADTVNPDESKRIRRRVNNYGWREQKLFFKDLLVPRPEERVPLVRQMHEDLGHFGEHRTLAEVRRKYFWHNRTADVKAVVKECQQCQLVKSSGSMRSGDEHLKNIHVCDLFYRVTLDTAGSLPETNSGNRYILVAIDHYSKWCEAKVVADHGAKTAARFLEDEIICRYGVPKFVLTDNGTEWAAEFDVMCGDYAIQHQRTAPQWPQCNGMAERMIKTIKHGITVLAANLANVNCWDQ
jgi:hypothetical protein